MENIFKENRRVFFGGPECEGNEDGVCLPPEGIDGAPEASDKDVDARIEKAMQKLDHQVESVALSMGLERSTLTNTSGNLEFHLSDGDKVKFKIELDADSGQVRIVEIPFQGSGENKFSIKNFPTIDDALAYIPETKEGQNMQMGILAKNYGLGIENDNGLYLFKDRKSGDHVFTIQLKATDGGVLIVQNTSTGGTIGRPLRSDKLSTLIKGNQPAIASMVKVRGGEKNRVADKEVENRGADFERQIDDLSSKIGLEVKMQDQEGGARLALFNDPKTDKVVISIWHSADSSRYVMKGYAPNTKAYISTNLPNLIKKDLDKVLRDKGGEPLRFAQR